MSLPTKERLLEAALTILEDANTEVDVQLAKGYIYLANSLPPLPTGDRPFNDAANR
jgi:hypothetical protein